MGGFDVDNFNGILYVLFQGSVFFGIKSAYLKLL